jgi:hypothetical protein
LVAFAILATSCIHLPHVREISRQRAIEIARPHVPFTPDRIGATRTMTGGRAIWRVTFRGRLPGQPALLFETMVVEIDRHSGEIVSIARS